MQRFIKNDDNTITDIQTGLTWSKTTLAEDVDYEAAETAVAKMEDGWRLPTVEELRELVDYTKRRPAIDTDAFPDTRNDIYWTSTPVAGHEDAARWVVGFSGGRVYDLYRGSSACVRAVRAGQ